MNRPGGTSSRAVAASPLGPLAVEVDAAGRLVRIELGVRTSRPMMQPRAAGPCAPVLEQLGEYFAGRRRSFDLELAMHGTAFQLATWRALQAIPWGTTLSYAQVARAVGSPRAMRAVGGANGANPLPIVVPCHRVVAADGTLGGYSGGLANKRWLLAHEGAAVRD